MDRETYEKQKPFAGEKKPSMLRRCVGHDYTSRQMYMVTMVTEGRRPLFGKVVGSCDAEAGSANAPHIELSELGQRVADEWNGISHYYHQIAVVALQMMPDHLHGILFVKERMEKDLSRVIRGFKTGCNRAYRELVFGPLVPSVATQSQPTGQQPTGLQPAAKPKEDRTHGLLFARGYNDRLLLRDGQLECWLHYLEDNPRRLLMKRQHPDLFRVQRGLKVGTQEFSAIGNRFLLDRPLRIQVQCSRRLTDEQIEEKTQECLALARQGAVLASPRARSTSCEQPLRRAIRSSSCRRTVLPNWPSPPACAWKPVPVANCYYLLPGTITTNDSPSAVTNACRSTRWQKCFVGRTRIKNNFPRHSYCDSGVAGELINLLYRTQRGPDVHSV